MKKVWLICGLLVVMGLSACTQHKALIEAKDEYVFCMRQNQADLTKCDSLRYIYEANIATYDALK